MRSQHRALGKLEGKWERGALRVVWKKAKDKHRDFTTLSTVGHNYDFQAYLTYLDNLCNYSQVAHVGTLPWDPPTVKGSPVLVNETSSWKLSPCFLACCHFMLLTNLSDPKRGGKFLAISSGEMTDHPNLDRLLASTPASDVLVNIKRSWELQEREWFGVTPVSQIFFFINGQKVICIAQRDMVEKCIWAPVNSGKPRDGPTLAGHKCALEFLAVPKKWIQDGTWVPSSHFKNL